MIVVFPSCAPDLIQKSANLSTPDKFRASSDTVTIATTNWDNYFDDPYLTALIDTALNNNQELNIFMQEVQMLRNEIQSKKGEYLPSVNIGVGTGVDKVGRYTRFGALEENLLVKENEAFPEPLGDFESGLYAQWEIDIWKKLRTAKKAAFTRYLASTEGRNFLVTGLISEIANEYYELIALDNQLVILDKNIEIQSNALEIVRLQKQSARVTELAVRRFEAQVYETRSLRYTIQQKIIEVENRINFLMGRYPQPIERQVVNIEDMIVGSAQIGIPIQLFENRPDIRRAELNIVAAKMDIKVAKANFYPSLGIIGGLGFQSYKISDLLDLPASLMYSIGGDITSPLLNRKAIKANYQNANARQIQAVFEYEQTMIGAFTEVYNLANRIDNLQGSYDLRALQVVALNESVVISNNLFSSARADYMEVLLTQKDALESRFELIETKKEQLQAKVNIYKALGGGWR